LEFACDLGFVICILKQGRFLHKGFEEFEHTADVGIKVNGNSLSELFLNAARGVTHLIVKGKLTGEPYKKNIKLQSKDLESLLILWLNEIIYLGVSERIILKKIRINSLDDTSISSGVEGLKLEEQKSAINEIKSATFHGLKIKKIAGGYKTKIIFDV